jgi:hypothetical protein
MRLSPALIPVTADPIRRCLTFTLIAIGSKRQPRRSHYNLNFIKSRGISCAPDD